MKAIGDFLICSVVGLVVFLIVYLSLTPHAKSQTVQPAAPFCLAEQKMRTYLYQRYGELITWAGKDGPLFVVLYMNREQKTWTLVSSNPARDEACIFAVGEGGVFVSSVH